MKLFLISVAAFLTLSFVPFASASGSELDLEKGPCIIYPGYVWIQSYYVGTHDTTIKGIQRDVLFIHVSTDDVTVTGAGLWTPGTAVRTPGVCYGSAQDLLALMA